MNATLMLGIMASSKKMNSKSSFIDSTKGLAERLEKFSSDTELSINKRPII